MLCIHRKLIYFPVVGHKVTIKLSTYFLNLPTAGTFHQNFWSLLFTRKFWDQPRPCTSFLEDSGAFFPDFPLPLHILWQSCIQASDFSTKTISFGLIFNCFSMKSCTDVNLSWCIILIFNSEGLSPSLVSVHFFF